MNCTQLTTEKKHELIFYLNRAYLCVKLLSFLELVILLFLDIKQVFIKKEKTINKIYLSTLCEYYLIFFLFMLISCI